MKKLKQGSFEYYGETVDYSRIKYIWGLDLSLECTGLAIFDFHEDKFVAIDHCYTGKVKPLTDGLDLLSLRLHLISQVIDKYMVKFPPSMVGIERLFIHPKHKLSAEVNYRVHGVINKMLYDIPQIYYPPTTLKATIIKGNLPKPYIKHSLLSEFDHLKKMFNHENYGTRKNPKWADEDEADAVSACVTLMEKNGLRPWEKRTIKEIKLLVEKEEELNKEQLALKGKNK